jgi:hypothetical protein
LLTGTPRPIKIPQVPHPIIKLPQRPRRYESTVQQHHRTNPPHQLQLHISHQILHPRIQQGYHLQRSTTRTNLHQP